jgi:hypothetical protein
MKAIEQGLKEGPSAWVYHHNLWTKMHQTGYYKDQTSMAAAINQEQNHWRRDHNETNNNNNCSSTITQTTKIRGGISSTDR